MPPCKNEKQFQIDRCRSAATRKVRRGVDCSIMLTMIIHSVPVGLKVRPVIARPAGAPQPMTRIRSSIADLSAIVSTTAEARPAPTAPRRPNQKSLKKPRSPSKSTQVAPKFFLAAPIVLIARHFVFPTGKPSPRQTPKTGKNRQ